jgi:hypothetical protein
VYVGTVGYIRQRTFFFGGIMHNPLARHPPWRQLVIVSIALPLVVVAAVLAFAWPAARVAPRDLPIGVVGATAQSQAFVAGLENARPDGFDVHLYADAAAARRAIEQRDVYGAFAPGTQNMQVFEASAAGPAVAQVLTNAATDYAARAGGTTTATDIVPLSRQDPRGTVLMAALLPLTICSILIAGGVGVVVRFRPAWRQILALLTVSVVAATGVYLIAQTWLGALPHRPAATWFGLAWTILAISSGTAGLIALLGPAGLGLSAVLMVFLGNPFSGVGSAPELLPHPVGQLGQWLPPGAAVSLLRSTAYFDCAGANAHLAVLIAWSVFGVAAIVVGHRGPIRFAAASAKAGAGAGPAQPLVGLATSQRDDGQPTDALLLGVERA